MHMSYEQKMVAKQLGDSLGFVKRLSTAEKAARQHIRVLRDQFNLSTAQIEQMTGLPARRVRSIYDS